MEGVDHLLNLLAIVQSEGSYATFLEDVHYGGQQSKNANFQNYPAPLRSLRQSLEDSNLCMKASDSIRTHLKRKIRHLQRRSASLVLEHGIKNMPDEILAHVFEAGHQMSEYSEFALRVSHVSHRFRQVSLQTHLLWTRLSSEHPDHQTETFISRSGQLNLQVTVSTGWRNSVDNLRSSLRLIGPHSGRCSRLLLRTFAHHHLEMMDEVGLTHFPRLQYISQAAPMSLQWNMPLLSHFKGFEFPFPPDDSFRVLPFLSHLTFRGAAFFGISQL
ncbi:hypothetical protein BD410DRAFT_338570 [Rickenella mellea]|uniref:Uncharacterized protein n=1 Tax=Rickenella mellea TaxID=50990 RepID=A0A4Y7QLQ4_9AGAM|nr:hypothetical protein BD410DRAFT_338570 [Rickenella mellea]